MLNRAERLISAISDESDLIDELVEVVQDQREALKYNNYDELQALMQEIQDLLFEIKTREAIRERAAFELAQQIGCEPQIAALSCAMTDYERALFDGIADRLAQSVFSLKAEMVILSGLIEQNERFSAMLLSEWRRIEGGASFTGGLDFRG